MRLETETETVEFKSTLAELKQGLISLVAMLNKHGEASLWFGVASNALVKGLTINEKTLRDVSQSIAAHIEPRIYPEITEKKLSNKTCLLVQAQGHQKPYFAFGRAYFRVADEDRQMSARELEVLILRRNREALRWDNEPSNLAIHTLNEKKIRQYLNRAGLPWDNTIRVPSLIATPLETDKNHLKTNKNNFEIDKTTKKISKTSFEYVKLKSPLKSPLKTVKTESDIDKTYRNHQTKTQELIFQFLSKQPQLSTIALANLIGVSVESVRHHITQLKKVGKLIHIGSKKGGYWLVIDPHE
jgi:predicted HTH transcriptional regulator